MPVAFNVRHNDTNNPIVKRTAVHIEVTGLTNRYFVGGADPFATLERKYYISADGPGVDDQKSHIFSGDHHTWDDFIFPQSGSYTLKLMRKPEGVETQDQQVATQAVTVNAS